MPAQRKHDDETMARAVRMYRDLVEEVFEEVFQLGVQRDARPVPGSPRVPSRLHGAG